MGYMSFLKNKIKGNLLIAFVYILFFAFPIYVIFKNPLFVPSLRLTTIFNFLLRYSALVALVFLSIEIFIGAFKNSLVNKFGQGVSKFHTINGTLTYILIFLHPLSLFIGRFLERRVIDPFFVYSDFCVICETRPELYLSLGRFAFWLVSFAFLAALLRSKGWWKDNWKYLHTLNYLVFALVAFHAWKIGSDIHQYVFIFAYFGALLLVVASILYKVFLLIKKK